LPTFIDLNGLSYADTPVCRDLYHKDWEPRADSLVLQPLSTEDFVLIYYVVRLPLIPFLWFLSFFVILVISLKKVFSLCLFFIIISVYEYKRNLILYSRLTLINHLYMLSF